MNLIVKLSVVALFGVACAACSNDGNAPTPDASASAPVAANSAPAASAIPVQAPASGATSAASVPPPVNGPTLDQIMQRPSFAKAFADMHGASSLPAWVTTGGTSIPSTRVQVDGKKMWLSQVCQAADCRGGRLFLLTDPAAHAMQGLLVEASGGTGDEVRKLTWLGTPDAAVEAFLRNQVAPR